MSTQSQEVRSDEVLQKKIDCVTPYVRYIGRADIGASAASPVWQIYRETVVDDVLTVEYASKGSYNLVWNDRTTYFGSYTSPSGIEGVVTYTTSAAAVRVGVANLDDRNLVTLANMDEAETVYWGYTNAVTTSTGSPIGPGQTGVWINLDSSTNVYIIAGASVETRVTESP